MANISNNHIAYAIYLSAKDKTGVEQNNVFKKIIEFLTRRRLLAQSKEILSALNKIINKDQGILEVRIWSKSKLDDSIRESLTNILQKRYGDYKYVLYEKLDESLLGGLRIEVNDEVIDLTLKNKIYKLKEHLINSHE